MALPLSFAMIWLSVFFYFQIITMHNELMLRFSRPVERCASIEDFLQSNCGLPPRTDHYSYYRELSASPGVCYLAEAAGIEELHFDPYLDDSGDVLTCD